LAENINIDFMPNRKTADTQRVGAVEDYLKLFTDRAKFCFSSIYDELSDIGKRLDGLDDFTISTPSSVDLVVENAVILQEKESQQVVHNFTKVHYVDGNSVGYGDLQNSIICNGYTIRANNDSLNPEDFPYYEEMTFAKSGKIMSNTVVVASSASDIRVYTGIQDIKPSGHRTLLGVFEYTNNETGERKAYTLAYTTNTYMTKWGIFPYWETINPPTKEFPYGLVVLGFVTRLYDGSEWDSLYTSTQVRVNIPFASEAEYNAAVGLTNTPIELIKIQDFQYLVPESQIIVDTELSEGSDNVIANSTVAKALSLKADKETVETLSLVVESKADITELEALSEDYNTAKADFDTRIRKLATASANHGIILNEHADMLELKADKTEVQSIAQAVEGKAESSDLMAHTGNTDNPHGVTKAQIGLSKVENKSSADILSELEIGGRNLLRGATTLKGNTSGNKITRSKDSEGFYTAFFDAYSPVAWRSVRFASDTLPLSAVLGRTVTLSFEVRSADFEQINSVETEGVSLLFAATESTSSLTRVKERDVNLRRTVSLTADWQKVVRTYTITPDFFTAGDGEITAESGFVPYIYFYSQYSGELRKFKLEIGNKSTDWTPAPEDVETRVTSLEERMATLEAAMLSLGGEI
jgi:hypothetical protein